MLFESIMPNTGSSKYEYKYGPNKMRPSCSPQHDWLNPLQHYTSCLYPGKIISILRKVFRPFHTEILLFRHNTLSILKLQTDIDQMFLKAWYRAESWLHLHCPAKIWSRFVLFFEFSGNSWDLWALTMSPAVEKDAVT